MHHLVGRSAMNLRKAMTSYGLTSLFARYSKASSLQIDPLSGAFAKFVPAFSNACLASGGDASHLQSATDLANAPLSLRAKLPGVPVLLLCHNFVQLSVSFLLV